MQAKVKTYENGLRLVTIPNPYVRSVTLGVWVGTGSCQETKSNNGISHFIEHMLFKGTEKRSAFEIADYADCLGAQVNAFTSKEATCYYIKCIDEHLESCFELLSDMYLNSTFLEEELARERGVVIEEISMTEDNPEDLCHEMLAGIAFKGCTLGMPIAGTAKNVGSFGKQHILDYMADKYTSNNTVIVVCGNVEHTHVDELVLRYFGSIKAGKAKILEIPKHVFAPTCITKYKDIEQANIGIAFPSFRFESDEVASAGILNNVLGGCMSSRLFQEVREKRGLCYSVYSFCSTYLTNGSFNIFTATNPSTAEQAIVTIKSVLDDLIKNGVQEDEFNRAKVQIKSALIMSQESTSSMMNFYGKYMSVGNRLFDIEEKLSKINSITIQSVNDILPEIFNYSLINSCYIGREASCDIFKCFK